MGRNPKSGKAVKNINTFVEIKTNVVKAKELEFIEKQPEVIFINKDKKKRKNFYQDNQIGGN